MHGQAGMVVHLWVGALHGQNMMPGANGPAAAGNCDGQRPAIAEVYATSHRAVGSQNLDTVEIPDSILK